MTRIQTAADLVTVAFALLVAGALTTTGLPPALVALLAAPLLVNLPLCGRDPNRG